VPRGRESPRLWRRVRALSKGGPAWALRVCEESMAMREDARPETS
jgi:hypothetical protein